MNFKLNIYLFLLLAVILSACDNTRIIDKNEQEWLKQHPNLTVGISPNAPPYQFVNEKGEISGIFIDFLTIIESRLNYSFKKVYQSDFAKLLADTKTGTIDILLEVQKTDERANYLAFTPPLLSHSHVFVVRSSQPNISTINNLKDRKISVVNLYAIHEYLGKNYPTIHLVPQFDDVSCLRSVSTGQSDAFVCQQAVATYFIEKEGISNLKISGELNYQNELAIASRKTIDTLNTILSKAVNSISNREKLNIYNTWLSYTVKPFYLEVKFWIIIFTLFLFGLFFTILFSLTLQQRVRQKTSELVLAKEETEESELRLKIAQAASKAGTWDWNIENNKYYWSDEFLSIFGMPTNTIAGSEAWRKVLHPDDAETNTELSYLIVKFIG